MPEAAQEAAARIAAESGRATHLLSLTLGSGWSGLVDAIADPGTACGLPMANLPGFVAPTAAGHHGSATSCLVEGVPTLVLAGRTHLYEGLGTAPVVHGVTVAAAAGCRAVVLTNAAGGLRSDMAVGDLVVLSDHLNLTGRSPLVGPRFVDLVDAYSPALRSAARESVRARTGRFLAEGVYAAMPGPQYETPAEIRMLRILGADLVGMSTVPETITARALGLQVLGISLVTNLAAGMTGAPLDHAEVLEAGADGAHLLAESLRALLPAAAATIDRDAADPTRGSSAALP